MSDVRPEASPPPRTGRGAPAPPSAASAFDTPRAGVAFGLFAYLAWGFFPLYFDRLGAVPPADVLAWRIVLCSAALALALLVRPGFGPTLARVRAVRRWGLVVAAALVIAINWLVFIHAIAVGEVLQSSLGYFLVPIVNTALGALVFAERPNRWKLASLGVAAIGMAASFALAGAVPGHALALAASFGIYGALRKRMDADATTGLLLETLLLAPFALGWILWAAVPLGALPAQTRHWLMLSGILTLLPLLAMGLAARRIELGTLGLLQYVTPVMHFALAVLVFGEALDAPRAVAFATTVLAVTLWLVGAFAASRRTAAPPSSARRVAAP